MGDWPRAGISFSLARFVLTSLHRHLTGDETRAPAGDAASSNVFY